MVTATDSGEAMKTGTLPPIRRLSTASACSDQTEESWSRGALVSAGRSTFRVSTGLLLLSSPWVPLCEFVPVAFHQQWINRLLLSTALVCTEWGTHGHCASIICAKQALYVHDKVRSNGKRKQIVSQKSQTHGHCFTTILGLVLTIRHGQRERIVINGDSKAM